MSDREEQLQVQLAGCLVAAEGGITGKQLAKPGDYGYSVSYEKVLLLRRAFEKLTYGKLSPSEVLDPNFKV